MPVIRKLFCFQLLLLGMLAVPAHAQWQFANPQPQPNVLSDVAYSSTLSMYVAVGNSGMILISTDGGANWTVRNNGLSDTERLSDLTNVVWAGTQFVVVGLESIVLTSSDGITWTQRDLGQAAVDLWDVSYNGAKIVATDNANSWVSTDAGASWQSYSMGLSGATVQSLAWGNSEFIAVGNAGVVTSPDGITWTIQAADVWSDVVWDGSLYVGVGDSGAIATSTDAITWTTRTSNTAQSLLHLSWDGSQFVATGFFGTVVSSADGINWSNRTSNTSEHLYSVIGSGSEFIALGDNGVVVSSSDAITWALLSSTLVPISTFTQMAGIAWGGGINAADGLYVAVGSYFSAGYSGKILTSSDGESWLEQTAGVNQHLADVAGSDSGFVVVGTAGTILYSVDGVTWTPQTSGTSEHLYAVAWGNDLFVAVGAAGTALTSPDGMTWTPVTVGMPNTDSFADVIWNGNIFLATGVGVYSSTNGVDWTEEVAPGSISYLDLCWDGTQFISVVDNGTRGYASSADGNNWNYSWPTFSPGDVACSGSRYVLTSSNRYATTYTSADALVWNEENAFLRGTLTDVAWSGTRFVGVGSLGSVLFQTTENSAPTADPGSNQTVNELATVTLSGIGNDADGSITNYLWEQVSGTGVTLSGANTDTATFTAPEVTTQQQLSFRLTVTDNDLSRAANEITVTVNNVNLLPSADAGLDQSVNEQTTVTLSGVGSDSDGSIASYSWSQISGTTVTLANGATDTATFTAPTLITQAQLGFRLTVTDNEGATATDDIIITVDPVNANPSANAGLDQTVNEQTTVTIAGSGSDGDGSIASYSWTQTGGTAVTLTNENIDTASFTAPTLTAQEQLTFQLTVTDNEGATATDTIIVTVDPVNANPSANAGLDQTVNEQTTVTLAGSGSDSDGSIANYSWSQISGTNVTLTNGTTDTATFSAPMLITQVQLTFRLTVTDSEGATATDEIIVTVNPVNLNPNASAGTDETVNEQTEVTLLGIGNDSDGSIVGYSWAQIGGTVVTLTNDNTDTASFTAPILTVQAQFTFRLTVTDNEGGSSSDDIVITVDPVNAAPMAEAGNDQTVNEGAAISLAGVANDTDGSIASTLWLQTGGSSVTLSAADTDTATFVAPDVSSQTLLVFQFTVTDNEGGVTSDTVNVTVNPVIESTSSDATGGGGGGALNIVVAFFMLLLLVRRRYIAH